MLTGPTDFCRLIPWGRRIRPDVFSQYPRQCFIDDTSLNSLFNHLFFRQPYYAQNINCVVPRLNYSSLSGFCGGPSRRIAPRVRKPQIALRISCVVRVFAEFFAMSKAEPLLLVGTATNFYFGHTTSVWLFKSRNSLIQTHEGIRWVVFDVACLHPRRYRFSFGPCNVCWLMLIIGRKASV